MLMGILLAVNLGNDADTTGAIYGQLAGAFLRCRKDPGGMEREAHPTQFHRGESESAFRDWEIADFDKQWRPSSPMTTSLLPVSVLEGP
jgi:ADP-ribosylglycohydrolase